MKEPPSFKQREGGACLKAESAKHKVQIFVPAVSLRTLTILAIAIFVAGFWQGRYLREIENRNGEAAGTVAPQQSATPAPGIAVAPPSAAAEPAGPAHIIVRLLKFGPEKIEIHPGDEVVWENKDLTPHTVTSEAGAPHELDSGSINPAASWRHRFGRSGTYPYYCTFHPEMKGTVVVK